MADLNRRRQIINNRVGNQVSVGSYGGISIGSISENNPYQNLMNDDLMLTSNSIDAIINPIADKYGRQQGWQSLMTPEEKQQVTWAQQIIKNHPKNYQYSYPEQPQTIRPDFSQKKPGLPKIPQPALEGARPTPIGSRPDTRRQQQRKRQTVRSRLADMTGSDSFNSYR